MAYISDEMEAAYKVAHEHYDSVRGWIGRNSWYVLPAVAVVFYAIGHLVGHHHQPVH